MKLTEIFQINDKLSFHAQKFMTKVFSFHANLTKTPAKNYTSPIKLLIKFPHRPEQSVSGARDFPNGAGPTPARSRGVCDATKNFLPKAELMKRNVRSARRFNPTITLNPPDNKALALRFFGYLRA